jgi:exodeoxyribonuclease-3
VRIITLNVNGIRSASGKGLFEWLRRQSADVVCLQEVRAQAEVLDEPAYRPKPYYCYFEPAVRKGYSGVAIYSRKHPDGLVRGFGSPEFDMEGRYLEIRFGNLSVVSVYLPSGSAGEERQRSKFRFLEEFGRHLDRICADGRDYILCGDWNIAHKEIDLKNWRSNQKNSGFLPEERAWLTGVLERRRMVDAFRELNRKPEQYTWWSNRGQSWAKNVGWRIDYQIASPQLRPAIRRERIYRDRRFSDHAPLIMDYDLGA